MYGYFCFYELGSFCATIGVSATIIICNTKWRCITLIKVASNDSFEKLMFTAKSVCIESDIAHDYAEIYTPSREKLPWDKTCNKPPTPPLHRFPSWESRIYQVANEGLSAAPTEPTLTTAAVVPPTRVVTSQGYCDISVPVYATVKGVSINP